MEKITDYIMDKDGLKTPTWARWMFRFVLYTCSLSIIALNTLNVTRIGLTPLDIKDLNGLLAFFIIAIHAYTKMIGFKIDPKEYTP